MDLVAAAEPAAAAAASGSGYWNLAMVLAAIGVLGLFARWRKARRPPPADAKAFRERDQEPDKYREVSDRALVELIETGREINARVDNKIRMLNRLVKDAEQCIARLEKLVAAADNPTPAPPSPAPAERGGDAGDLENGGSRRFRSNLQARVVSLREEGKSVAEISAATGLSTIEIQLALEHAEQA